MSTLFNIDELDPIKNNISIYILRLENENFYVGQAIDVEKRLIQHLKGKLSSDWTKMHKPIDIYKQKKTGFNKVEDAIKLENLTTIWCMKRFGWQNVRGGDFCTLDENKLRFLLALNSDIGSEILPIEVSKKYNLTRDKEYIFILELQENKYFVGHTSNIFLAIINEFNGLGSVWTKQYKPVKLLNLYPLLESKISKRELINKFVEVSMKKYGFKNVRGGDFFNLDERKHKNKVLNYTGIFKK